MLIWQELNVLLLLIGIKLTSVGLLSPESPPSALPLPQFPKYAGAATVHQPCDF
jgi:hypothetical protein